MDREKYLINHSGTSVLPFSVLPFSVSFPSSSRLGVRTNVLNATPEESDGDLERTILTSLSAIWLMVSALAGKRERKEELPPC